MKTYQAIQKALAFMHGLFCDSRELTQVEG
jgi:hypothetical protein